MATPAQIHIFRDCGLEIEIDRSKFHGLDYVDSSFPWNYKVTNYNQICHQIFPNNCSKATRQEDLTGWLSPTSRITVPPRIKKKAGIPDEAKSYAFMYPPQGLAEIILQGNRPDNEDSFYTNPEFSRHKQGIESAALLGGFAYFDKNCDCICINALSLQRSEDTLKFSGPFKVNESVCDELYSLRRPHPLQLDIFHEIGFVRYAWVRPREVFQFKGVFTNDGPINSNGSLIFFRENGTGVAYALDKSNFVDPTGYVDILSEAVLRIGEAKFIQQVIQPKDEVNDWGVQVKRWTKSMPTAKLAETLKDKRRVIHMACHAVLGHEFISDVLSNVEEKRNISYQDSFGWNPLHYACCFSSSDCILIKLLIAECPEAVVQLDVYDRSPLHIACNSNTSEEVIAILVKADKYMPKVTINKKTKRFGLLPLHLACYNGAKDGIINILLDADYGNKTAIQKSRGGQLPLHLAILKKLPASMVKALLDVDSKLSKSDKSNFDSGTQNFDGDIYQSFDGKLPLHLACYNNSSSEIIQLLLRKDEHNTTINETVNDPKSALEMSITTTSLSHIVDEQRSDGVVALHLAMRHGSADVISLLLRKEMEKGKLNYHMSVLQKRDILGRTPLHIACQYNVGSQITQYLVNLDPFKSTTQICDTLGFMPIHLACENEDTSAETINILLHAEEQYLTDEFKKGFNKRRSTHTGDAERKRTPLYLAVKSCVKDAKVFEILLQPENFRLAGFDDQGLADLAEVVQKSKVVQLKVTGRLSERPYFFLLFAEFYACTSAIIFFIGGSVKYTEGSITLVYPYFLLASTIVFIMRELLQILSTGTEYISDFFSWVEILNICLLLVISHWFFKEAAVPGYERPVLSPATQTTLAIAGFTVIFQILLFLRNTIIQFAKFVGGLVIIVKRLVAFLVVSFLLLLAFAYAFWILRGVEKDCKRIKDCLPLLFVALLQFSPLASGLVEIAFGVFMVIILLNILIAIVDEAWTSTSQKSNALFWKYRLEKIYELRYAKKLNGFMTTLPKSTHFYSILIEKIDCVRDISYGGKISWTKAPYHVLTDKDHYDNPQKYFDPDLVELISDAHSLQATIYWADIDMEGTLTARGKLMLILKWLGSLVMYVMLIMLGIPTFGILWPKKFRASLLTW